MAVSFLHITPGKPKIIINISNRDLKEKNLKTQTLAIWQVEQECALMLQNVKAQIWKQNGRIWSGTEASHVVYVSKFQM